MINGNRVLGVIPARAGSKGLPGKNLKPLIGKPLLAWAIEQAKKSKYIDRLILSSEDPKIISVAREWGCEVPFLRPAELARDEIPAVDVVLHAIDAISENYRWVILLQPTSPLRLAKDIDACIEICANDNAPACASVTEVKEHPFWMFTIDKSNCLVPLIKQGSMPNCRQFLPKICVLNGAVFVARSDWLRQNRTFFNADTRACFLPQERSLDIDTELDLKICEVLLNEYTS